MQPRCPYKAAASAAALCLVARVAGAAASSHKYAQPMCFQAPVFGAYGARTRTGRSQRLYMNGNNGKDPNKDRLDDMYYQRFMGMNDGGASEEAIMSELAQLDPGTIDSLRLAPAETEARTVGGGSNGFLSSMKKAFPGASVGATMTDDMMMGPKVYIIPQNQGEAPLEIRSVAPGQRSGRRAVIAEIPGRKPTAWTRRSRELSQKVDDVKRSIKDVPTRLTEMQIQNLRSANPAPREQSRPDVLPGAPANTFQFPSFPSSSSSSSSSSQSLRRLSRGKSGKSGSQAQLKTLSKDWRVWVGGIAAVSFLSALANALSHRSELIV